MSIYNVCTQVIKHHQKNYMMKFSCGACVWFIRESAAIYKIRTTLKAKCSQEVSSISLSAISNASMRCFNDSRFGNIRITCSLRRISWFNRSMEFEVLSLLRKGRGRNKICTASSKPSSKIYMALGTLFPKISRVLWSRRLAVSMLRDS